MWKHCFSHYCRFSTMNTMVLSLSLIFFCGICHDVAAFTFTAPSNNHEKPRPHDSSSNLYANNNDMVTVAPESSPITTTDGKEDNEIKPLNPLMDVAAFMNINDEKDLSNDCRPPPGERENEKFECDPNVQFWRDFQSGGFESAQQNAESLAAVASRFASKGPEGLDYWLRHTARSGYFFGNAALGTIGSRLHDLLVNNDTTGDSFTSKLTSSSVSRLVLEAALCYEQDFERVQNGKYIKPYDMFINTRQASPIFYGTQTARFVREAIGTLSRRKRAEEKDRNIWISSDATPGLYPEYYRTAFHYQTDGWMSKRSADVYETSTETLFLGRQDAMQRTALSPIVSFVKEEMKGAASTSTASTGPMKVLEVACGTGRFMTFARDNLPQDTEYTALDLSPYYLDAARDNDANWRSIRKNRDTTAALPPAIFVQAQAENLPFPDDGFDVVVCMYLFHELPREVRAKVSMEMARVVRPGGRVVFTDSVQKGDRPVLDKDIGNFGNMNEPYYKDYIEDNLPLHFEGAGLTCLTKNVASTTKTLVFSKPPVV